MKRWMLLLALLLVLAFVAPACGPTTAPEVVVERTAAPEPTEPPEPTGEVVVEETAPSEPTGEVVVEETAPPGPPGEAITFWTWASTDFEYDALEQMVDEFRAETGIDVQYWIIR